MQQKEAETEGSQAYLDHPDIDSFDMDNAFVRSAQDVLQHFGVTEQAGLSDNKVEASRQKYGRNGMIRISHRAHSRILIALQPYLKTHLHRCGSSYSSNSKINLSSSYSVAQQFLSSWRCSKREKVGRRLWTRQ